MFDSSSNNKRGKEEIKILKKEISNINKRVKEIIKQRVELGRKSGQLVYKREQLKKEKYELQSMDKEWLLKEKKKKLQFYIKQVEKYRSWQMDNHYLQKKAEITKEIQELEAIIAIEKTILA